MKAYHASPHSFDFPDYAKLTANRKNHVNGVLGLWCSLKNEPSLTNFGKNLYELETLPGPKASYMAIATLAGLSREGEAALVNYRNKLLKSGITLLLISEKDASVKQLVVLDFSVIQTFNSKQGVTR